MKLIVKLWLALGLAVLLTALVVSGLLLGWLERRGVEQRQADVHRAALLLGDVARPALSGREAATELQERLVTLGRETDTRFTVIRPDGRVVADSQHDPSGMDDHSQRPEILDAVREGQGTSTRRSDTLHARLLYVAVRVEAAAGTAPLGFARAALPLEGLARRQWEIRRVALVAGGLGVALVILLGYVLAARLTRPLGSMTEAARILTEGQGTMPALPTTTSDELGALARALEVMAQRLGERISTSEADRAKLIAILASMTEGVVAVDRAGRVVHMNSVAGGLLGTDPDTAVGLLASDVSRVEGVGSVLSECLATLQGVSQEVLYDTLPRPRSLILRATPARNPRGEVQGAVLVILDQTDLRRVEAIRRDFVANVSHELKTPLTALLALLETLVERPELEEETRQSFLARCLRQSERLATLVQDLLVLSRIESLDATKGFQLVDLRQPVVACADGLRERAQAKGLHLSVEVGDAPLEVLGDAEYLRQVADNLLSNAIMYTAAEGRIDLSVQRHGAEAVIEVKDTGIGIPVAERERIFERFYRIDCARSRDLGGTGLGLAIVKHLVLAHGGSVEVEGSFGLGTTFRVRLPLPA
jgi:two-component system phosphate regulon sensor histidine kinase PhoR